MVIDWLFKNRTSSKRPKSFICPCSIIFTSLGSSSSKVALFSKGSYRSSRYHIIIFIFLVCLFSLNQGSGEFVIARTRFYLSCIVLFRSRKDFQRSLITTFTLYPITQKYTMHPYVIKSLTSRKKQLRLLWTCHDSVLRPERELSN